MASLEGNKIAAAVLVAGIAAMLSGFVSNQVFSAHHGTEEGAEEHGQAYPIEAAEASTGAAPAEEAAPLTRDEILALVQAADLEAGAKVARKCTSCHSLERDGANKIGPHMWGVVGRPFAAIPDFAYSKALQARAGEGAVWDMEALYHFVAKPSAYLKGTKMSFAGLSKEKDRGAILLYLHSLADNPAPIE